MLTEHFNQRFSHEYGRPVKKFAEDAIEALQGYDWFGNVRELKNTIERIVIMSAKATITSGDLPEMDSADGTPAASFRFPTFKDATDAYQREFIQHKLVEFDGNVAVRITCSVGDSKCRLQNSVTQT